MKKLLTFVFAALLVLPSTAFATPVSWDYTTNLLQPLQSGWSALIKGSYFQATSTSAVNRFPNALFTNASSTNATTSALDITSLLTFNGVTGNSWDDFCTTITGGSGLCDGTDASGSGSSAVATSSAETATYVPFWTSTGATPAALSGGESTFAYDSTLNKLTISNASTTALSIGSLTNILKQSGGVVIDAVADTDYQVPLTFGDGLTRTVNDVDCDTASGSVFGCLASADWTTFNGKLSTYDAFTHPAYGGSATTSLLTLGDGIIVGAASSTIAATNLHFGSLADGTLAVNTEKVYVAATTTAGTGLTYSAGAFNINTTQNIAKLSNLTSNGFVKTSGGDGTLSVDTSTYLTSALTSIGPTGQTSDGPTVTFATSSSATNGLTPSLVITGSGDTQTFTSSISGTLTVPGGGTGVATLTGLAKGNGASAFTAAVDGTDFTLIDANTCTNQLFSAVTAAGVFTCASINNGLWSGTDLSVANGGTGLSTFGGTNHILYTTAADTLSSEAAFTYDPSTDKITAVNAAFTNATSTGTHTIPVGTAPAVQVAGQHAIDTTSDQYKYFGNQLNILSPTRTGVISYATSTSWTGTTTLPLGPAPWAETWKSVQCFTDTGTVSVSFYDGTNRFDYIPTASTTVNTFTFTTNNTFTAGEKRYVDIGTPASTPTKISCTIKATITSD